MANKNYTEEQERMARFAKAMGHPARMAILEFLLRQETCFFGDIHSFASGNMFLWRYPRRTAYSQGYSVTAS